MLPVLLRWNWAGIPFRLGSYPFLIFCGVLAALLIVLRRSREVHLSPRALVPVFTASILAGFLGARLGSLAQTGGGGLVLYGGLITGLLTGLLVARWQRLPSLRIADLAVPGVLLATAFGRIGCLFAGCCFGVVGDAGLSYPRGSHAFRDQLRHGLIDSDAAQSLPTAPVVLLESVALVILFLIASDLWRRRLRPGTALGISGILYSSWRFVAEFWRADNLPYWPGGLTFSQGISLVVAAGFGIFLLLRRPRPIAPLPPVEVHPASALQLLIFLAAPCLSLSAISCGSHQNHEPHTTSGVHQYRKQDTGKPKTPAPKEEKKDSEDSWFVDCMVECTGDCIEACTDAMCDSACSDGPSGADGDPFDSLFGRLQPGKRIKGSFSIEAVVNKRLSVVLKMKGSLWADKPTLEGARQINLRLKETTLDVGEEHWRGSGDVDLLVTPGVDIKILRSTLPPAFMEALAALDAFSGNLLRGATAENQIDDLAKVVQEELADPSPHAEFSLSTHVDGYERWILGEGHIVDGPAGTRKLYWTLKE